MKSLLDKVAARWYWPVIIALAVFFLLAVRNANQEGRVNNIVRDSLFALRTDVTVAKAVASKLRLEKASEVEAKKPLYAEIARLQNSRPPARQFVPIVVNNSDSASLVEGIAALQTQNSVLLEDNARLNAIVDATAVVIDSIKTVDRKAEMVLLDRVDSLEVVLDLALHKVNIVIKATRRPWYKKTWSVVKQTGDRAIIFFAGRASTKLVP